MIQNQDFRNEPFGTLLYGPVEPSIKWIINLGLLKIAICVTGVYLLEFKSDIILALILFDPGPDSGGPKPYYIIIKYIFFAE